MSNKSNRLTWNFKLILVQVKEKIRMTLFNLVKIMGRPVTQDITKTLIR